LLQGLLRTTTPDVNTLGLEESDQRLLPQFVQTAKQHVSPSLLSARVTYKKRQHVHPLLSVGGWGGSRFFSSAVATAANRTAFAQAVMKAVLQYELDGVEFEYACFRDFSEYHFLILSTAGRLPESRESVATPCPRTIVPTSFPSYRRSAP